MKLKHKLEHKFSGIPLITILIYKIKIKIINISQLSVLFNIILDVISLDYT